MICPTDGLRCDSTGCGGGQYCTRRNQQQMNLPSGWQCPGCHRCYGPQKWQCDYCVPSLKDRIKVG